MIILCILFFVHSKVTFFLFENKKEKYRYEYMFFSLVKINDSSQEKLDYYHEKFHQDLILSLHSFNKYAFRGFIRWHMIQSS